MTIFKSPLEFEWDHANRDKNLRKHRVTNAECEEAFFDPHKRVLKDVLNAGTHERQEKRYIMIGKTKAERALFLVFTFRASKIRVISARDMNRKERGLLP